MSQSEYTVTDFIANVHGRIERNIKGENPEMQKIFFDRRKFAQHLSYRAARESAAIAKVPGMGGTEAYTERMQQSVDNMHRGRRYAIPEGDPLFGNYGTSSTEHTTGKQLYLVDLTVAEKKLVAWLKNSATLQSVVAEGEMWCYTQLEPNTRVLNFFPEFRTKIWDIVDGQTDNSFEAPWREECVIECVDQIEKTGGDRIQTNTATLDQHGIEGDLLQADPEEVLSKVIDREKSNPSSIAGCLSLMEQMLSIAALEKNKDVIKEIARRWQELNHHHNLAACDHPVGGLVGLMAKCAAENIDMLQFWMGARPITEESTDESPLSVAPDA
jgi:hypothetical protein